MTAAGVVLAGGRSSRMGTDKAALEWHGSTLLRRVAGLVRRGVDGPVVVVHAPGREPSGLPRGVEVCADSTEGRGPLCGMAAGLAAVVGRADVAFVAATDLPFLHPVFVRRVVRALEQPAAGRPDIALPVVGGRRQPLAAAYRTELATVAAQLVAEDRLRPAFLLDGHDVRLLDETELLADARLTAVDPGLASVRDLDDERAYVLARRQPAPTVTVQALGVPGARRLGDGRRVRAATVAGAAAAVGLALDRHLLAAVNGDQTGRDGTEPLAEGDTVTFLAAAAGG